MPAAASLVASIAAMDLHQQDLALLCFFLLVGTSGDQK
jgi:hypothetical protein